MKTTRSGTIEAYIAAFPREVQTRLKAMHRTIRRAAPAATERIAYGVPTFHQHENLVHFAGFNRHVGFYPAPSAIAAFQKALVKYKTAKGSVQFPHDEPLPLALVTRMVKFRVAEVTKRKGKGGRAKS